MSDSSSEQQSTAEGRFSPVDFGMFVVAGLTAEPLCHAGWDAIVSGEHLFRGIAAVVGSLILGGASASFHWWKRYTKNGREWVQHNIGHFGDSLLLAVHSMTRVSQ